MTPPNRTPSQERWLRFFNTVGYNMLAPLYASIDWLTLGAWAAWIRRALDYVPKGKTVLEVGFGPGKLHVDLARRFEQTIGLDFAIGMCRYTQRRLQREGLIPKITQGSVFELPYPSNTFDTVVSTFAFSGFSRGDDAMGEMVRVTKPDGNIVLVDISLPRDNNRVGVFWARLWERVGDFLYDQPELMRQAGLKIITFEEFGPGRHLHLVVGQKPSQASE